MTNNTDLSLKQTKETFMSFVSDFQKLEREARICRKLQHPNIGKLNLKNKLSFVVFRFASI